MPTYDPKKVHPRHFYQLFMGVLQPRPIGWVTTRNDDESMNLAPMSCFNAINTRPPMVMISIGDQDGELKHTTENILRTKECVIHIPTFDQLEKVHQSAGHYPKNQSEISLLNLSLTDSYVIQTSSLNESVARMECVLHSSHDLPTNHVLFLEVVHLSIDSSIMENGVVSHNLFHPIARLSGGYYASLGERVHLKKYKIYDEAKASSD